jgi:hypothetical protein
MIRELFPPQEGVEGGSDESALSVLGVTSGRNVLATEYGIIAEEIWI